MEITYKHLTSGLLSADGMQIAIGFTLIAAIFLLWAWYEYQNERW
jgi:hypothetical protein